MARLNPDSKASFPRLLSWVIRYPANKPSGKATAIGFVDALNVFQTPLFGFSGFTFFTNSYSQLACVKPLSTKQKHAINKPAFFMGWLLGLVVNGESAIDHSLF